MQTFEAIISLLFLVTFLSFVAVEQHAQVVDDSLYKYQLANDVWRVVYLRNGINADIEQDVNRIGELTNLCIFIDDITNCEGEDVEQMISTERITVLNGELKKIMVTISKKK